MRDESPNSVIQRSFEDEEFITTWHDSVGRWSLYAVIGYLIVRKAWHLILPILSHPAILEPTAALAVAAMLVTSVLLAVAAFSYWCRLFDWAVANIDYPISSNFDYPINAFGEFHTVETDDGITSSGRMVCVNCGEDKSEGTMTRAYTNTVRFGLVIDRESDTRVFECRRCIEADPIERQFLAAGLELPDYDTEVQPPAPFPEGDCSCLTCQAARERQE